MIYSNEYVRIFDNIARVFKKGTTWFYLLQQTNDWSFIFLSENIESIGYKSDEFLSRKKKLKNLVYGEDWKSVKEQLKKAIRQGDQEFSFEHRIITSKKEIRTVENYFRVKRNGSAEGDFIEGVLIDVTEYNKLNEKVSVLSKAVEQSSASVVITDIKGQIQYANKKCCEVTGYNLNELIGKNPRVLKGGYTTSDEYKNLWETISAGNDWIGEFHNKKKNGEYFWEKAVISPVKTRDEKISHYIAIKEDITRQKNIENQIIKLKESYKNLFNNSKDIILTSDINGNILEMNPEAEKKLHRQGNNLFNFQKLFLEQDDYSFFMQKLQQEGVVNNLYSKINISKGQTILAKINSYPLFSDKNEIVFQTVLHELNDDFVRHNKYAVTNISNDIKKI